MSNLVPEGWHEQPVGDFDFDISDGNYSAKYPKQSDFLATGVPFIRANNIKNHTVVSSDMRYISSVQHADLKKGHLKTGDILISTRGDIGQVAKVPDEFVGANINAQLVRINTKRELEAGYLLQYLLFDRTRILIKELETGTALKQLPVGKLKQLMISFPPLPEQQKIAAILTSVDEVIEKTQAQIEKLKDLKTAMMQELLTKGIGHVEFKDSPVGRIPVGWGITTLGNVGKWKGGGTPSKSNELFWTGSIPWVSPKDMKVEYISKTKDSISNEAIEGSSTNLVDKNSLLIVVRSGILQHTLPIAIANCELTINQDMKALTLFSNFCSQYIYHYIKANNHKILRATLKAGNTVESIDFAEFSNYQIPNPPLKEQVEIANAVESVANNIRSKELLMSSYKHTKKALMQDLLTGKVRVNTELSNTSVAVG